MMRKARYDMQQVVCPNSSCIGYSSNIARPGCWVAVREDNGEQYMARVLGRIAESDKDGINCKGYLAVVRLHDTHCAVRWVHPAYVRACWEKPPHKLFAWLTGDEWVKTKHDIARIVAMGAYGSLCESYISNRDNAEQAYNARPEYIQQFILP